MIHCLRCKKRTETKDSEIVTLKNGRKAETGTCIVCETKKFKIKGKVQGGDLVSVLNSITRNFKLPGQRYEGEMHYPNANFMGPGTRLDLRLNPNLTPKQDSVPINRVDEAAYRHDLWYNQFTDPQHNQADRLMMDEIDSIEDPTPKERLMRAAAKPMLLGKSKLGLGVGIEKKKNMVRCVSRRTSQTHYSQV